MIIETVTVGPLQTNCYVLAAGPGSGAAVIDPGDDAALIRQALERHRLQARMVINTHGHFDHIGCDDAFGVPVHIHQADSAALSDARKNFSVFFTAAVKVRAPVVLLHHGQRLKTDGLELEVLHLPGHSPGGIALRLWRPRDDCLFSGDSLFAGSIGRTDLGGSEEELIAGIKERLMVLDDRTEVYPGHGPRTTIGDERRTNPFLR